MEGLEIPSVPIGFRSSAGTIRLAVGPNGEARLLLPLAGAERVSGIDVGSALAVTVSTFMLGERAQRYLDLVCLSRDLEHVFGEVVDEILSRVTATEGCIDAVRTTLHDFRSLLAERPSIEIERSRVVGLVAELLLLNRVLDVSPSGWQSWRGPTGDRHDFRTAGLSLEVKASMRSGSASVSINGLEQLEAPAGGTLHLAHFILEPVSGGLLTVAGLGERALARSNNPAGLRELLAAIGCTDVRGEEWNRQAFRIESEKLYKVEGSFPRIVPSSFQHARAPAGVAEVNYNVDLSLASSCLCSPAEFQILVQGLAR
ncbi:MAG: PD-(D/E)XK motif protein [Roseibium aggregatum]